ncbi:MAG TPA: alpha/beta hydrolase [Parafilimonas sp.]|nr:alpha/beta hydrolase [Parafilimonas sp.]
MNQQKFHLNSTAVNLKMSGLGKNTIVFIHGNSQSADSWLPQLQSKKLNEHYQLIAIDLPGHGESGRCQNNPENYRPAKIAILIKDLIDKLKIKNYILAGLSYGTNIIGEMQLPLRGCAGIMLAGACIVNEEFPAEKILKPIEKAEVITAANPSDEDLKSFAFAHLKNKDAATNFIKTYRITDPVFREQLAKALMEGNLTDELTNIQNFKVPVCVAFGKDETIVNTNYLNNYNPLWKQKVFLIDGAGHAVNEEQSEVFNDLLFSFSEDVFK